MTEDNAHSKRGVSRRQLLIGGASAGGALAVGGALTGIAAGAGSASQTASSYHLQVLSSSQADLFGAMADRIFPEDSESPGARDMGFIPYFDGQLASSWGSGDGLYQHSPAHDPVSSGHGYQLTTVPKELFPHVADKIAAYVQGKYGKSFSDLSADQQDAVLTDLENGKVDLGLSTTEYGYTSAFFFSQFVGLVQQAVFADPMYGGNIGMAGWKYIGYPGDPMGYGDAYWTVFPHQDDRYYVAPRSISMDTMGGFQDIQGADDMSGMRMESEK
jgi:gluconate 2-dehydrogenase gamma chain